jgi:regulator of sirC expression with transglutaminase-like and TPR domain
VSSLPDQFAELVERPDAQIPLDRSWALLSARADPAVDIDTVVGRLDDLAAGCREPTLDGLLRHLFTDLGFAGNQTDYYDPANSYLHQVLDRRVGIPISLSVLTMEVGRRVGVPVAGVGLPGHFVLRDKVDPTVFVDPFAGGALLSADRLASIDPAWLEPVGPRAILNRMLANLVRVFQQRRDHRGLLWALELRVRIPGAAADEERVLHQLRARSN